MNEKRFAWKTEKLQNLDDEILMVVDNTNKEWKGHILNIVDLLNEQQATISKLEEENEQLKKENEKLTKMLNANYKTNNELVQYIQMLESDNDE